MTLKYIYFFVNIIYSSSNYFTVILMEPHFEFTLVCFFFSLRPLIWVYHRCLPSLCSWRFCCLRGWSLPATTRSWIRKSRRSLASASAKRKRSGEWLFSPEPTVPTRCPLIIHAMPEPPPLYCLSNDSWAVSTSAVFPCTCRSYWEICGSFKEGKKKKSVFNEVAMSSSWLCLHALIIDMINCEECPRYPLT